MRIRFKKWARPELEASKFYEDNPEEWKGKWKEHFANNSTTNTFRIRMWKRTIYIKISIVENQDTNYISNRLS